MTVARLAPFQPDHPQLLINTDWGLDAESVDRAAAKERGLVKWKRRWVSRAKRKQLRREHYAYSAIRSVAALSMFGGFVTACQILAEGGIGWRIYAVVAGGMIFVSGVQLLSYRAWARWLLLGTLSVDFSLLVVGVVWGTTPLFLPGIRLLFLVLFASYFFSSTARVIFGPPAAMAASRAR